MSMNRQARYGKWSSRRPAEKRLRAAFLWATGGGVIMRHPKGSIPAGIMHAHTHARARARALALLLLACYKREQEKGGGPGERGESGMSTVLLLLNGNADDPGNLKAAPFSNTKRGI